MARTPNREHGDLIIESMQIEPTSPSPQPAGSIRYINDSFLAKDALGTYDPRYGNLPEAEHEQLDSLTHNLAENTYEEVTRVNNRLESVVIWESSARTRRIRDTVITRDANQMIQSYVVHQYDAQGAVRQTLTHTISRDATRRVINVTTVRS